MGCSAFIFFDRERAVLRWAEEQPQELRLEEIGESYGRYRLHIPELERGMMRSLESYGQLAPIVVVRQEGHWELIDGFKRLGAARKLPTMDRLLARQMEADEHSAKAAIYGLNRAGGRTREMEEAWIVHALVREDGLMQVEVAELLGRHKSWVCRRLALIEKLGPEARADLQVGLLTPSSARQLVRLPTGNQTEVLELVRREGLSTNELTGIVDLWVQCPARLQQQYILQHPREALAQEKGVDLPPRDPRLSTAGNRIFEQLGTLLRQLARMEVWLAHQGRTGITPEDRRILQPRFERLSRDATSVAALSADMAVECDHDGRIHSQRHHPEVLQPSLASPHCEDARCGPEDRRQGDRRT
jgi:ParB-like chromosome segregation protein Spo0J